MKKYLFYIKEIVGSSFKGTILTFENLVSSFLLNDRASQDGLLKCDYHFNQKLPDDYKSFLQNYNGGILFKVEDFAGYKLFSTNELIKQNEFQKENFGLDWDENIILFCECIGDGEFLGFRINESMNYEIIYCIMDMMPQEWVTIDNSFENLMNKLITEKGRKYWLDS